ncbi:MAG: hypothetical protein ACI4TX_03240 [Christensenellales bacterium]
MKECLIVGMALGFLVGAVLVQSNKQAQDVVKQGKEMVTKKIQEIASDCKQKIEQKQD